MAGTIAFVGIDETIRRLISRNEGLFEGVAFENFEDARGALAWVQGGASDGDILFLGPSAEEPVSLAERALSQSKHVEVILCALPERFERLSAEAERSPLVGRRVRCVSMGDAEGVVAALRESIAWARARRRHQATISASLARLGAGTPRPARRAQYIEHLWMHIPLGVLVVSASDGQIIDLNRQAEQILDPQGGAKIANTDINRYFPELERERLHAVLARTDTSPSAHAFPLLTEGEPRYVDLIVAATHVEETLLVLLEDITERMRIEEERARHFEQLEQKQAEIEALSTPIIQVWENVLALPIVGVVDARRVSLMTGELLSAVVRVKARYVILDLTGVQKMDAEIADSLLKMVGAAHLLGTSCIFSGVSSEVAQTMVNLDVELGKIKSFCDLHSALRFTFDDKPTPKPPRKKPSP